MKHGLTARAPLIRGENPEEYRLFVEGVFRDFAPLGMTEEALTEVIAVTLWQMRRVPVLEAALFAYIERRRHDEFDPVDEALRTEGRLIASKYINLPELSGEQEEQARIGEILAEAITKGDLLSKLSKYDSALVTKLERATNQLNKLIALRPIEQVPEAGE